MQHIQLGEVKAFNTLKILLNLMQIAHKGLDPKTITPEESALGKAIVEIKDFMDVHNPQKEIEAIKILITTKTKNVPERPPLILKIAELDSIAVNLQSQGVGLEGKSKTLAEKLRIATPEQLKELHTSIISFAEDIKTLIAKADPLMDKVKKVKGQTLDLVNSSSTQTTSPSP